MRRRVGPGAALCMLCMGIVFCGSLAFAQAQQQPQQQQPQPQQQEQKQPEPQQQQRQQKEPQARGGQQTTGQPAMQQPSPQVAGQRPVVMTLVTSASRLASAPTQYYGLPVSVHAPVSQVFGPQQSFTLDEDNWFAGPDVLVLVPNPTPAAGRLDQNDYVTVVGQVRPYVRAELERDYDWFGGDLPGINIDFQSRPVIVADIVRTSDGIEIATDPRNVTRVFVTSPGFIAQTPGRFYGRTVSVRAEVEDLRSQRLFTLDEDMLFAGPDVLVLNPFPALAPEDGEVVTVLGTVRPFITAEFERDYDWFDAADYGANLETFERRPIVIAHSIIGRGARELVRVMPDFTLERSELALEERNRPGATGAMATAGRTGQSDRPAGTAGRQGQPQGGAQQQGAATQQQPVTDISQLLDTTAADRLIGRTVTLTAVPVQQVVDNRTILIGPSADRAVAVRLAEGVTAPTAGQQVMIQGRIMRTPADATGAMTRAPYFVQANQVRQTQ